MLTHAESGTAAVAEDDTRLFCFDESRCACPSGGTTGATQMDGRDMVFSMAASEQKPLVDVIAVPWNATQFCKKTEDPASDNGDPHVLSFDGVAFDSMARGEFVAARDERGDFEVQVRHDVLQNPVAALTGTNAVAISDGTHRVMFKGNLNQGADRTITVDGTPAADITAELQVGAIDVTSTAEDHWTATWTDGTTVDLRWNHGWFVSVALATERVRRVTGLLGTANGDFRDDLVLADGTHINPDDQAIIELEYAKRWYFNQRDSLFDYQSGESTVTFRVPLPKAPSPASDKVVQQCTDALPGATSAEVAACAYDVAATATRATSPPTRPPSANELPTTR